MEIVTSERPREAAAERLLEALREVLDRAGHARVAIPGGSAMGVLVDAAGHVERERVRLTWTDERCVPHDDPASNRGALHRALGGAFPIELALWLDEERASEALARVREGLQRTFEDALDVSLLGMGEDGHVASLFVGRSEPAGALVYAISDSPKPPPARITLSRRMLATATRTILYATGEAKRDALRRLRRGDPSLPATGLAGLTVVTDLALRSL